MQLTTHFTLEEFERSATAEARGINNKVPEEMVPTLRRLCVEVLEPLRLHVREPVRISSGYRCPELNTAVGGVRNSQHMRGEAADIYCSDKEKLRAWYVWIRDNCRYHQLLLEHAGNSMWIHVSLREAKKEQ